MITLGNAARQLGLSKPTLSKAISRGQLSATRHEDGSFAIDPSELARWYESARHRFHQQRGAVNGQRLRPSTGGADTANGSADGTDGADDIHLRYARLEVEMAGLQQLLAAERKRAEEIRTERDDWKEQAKRLALAAPPIVTPAPANPPPEAAPPEPTTTWQRFLRWRRAG